MSHPLLLLSADDVCGVLKGSERVVVDIVRDTYMKHGLNETQVPQASFLKFPGGGSERMIASASFIDGDHPIAGMKWIASFPRNKMQRLSRASAVVVLNSLETGLPYCLLEGSAISAQRTAASAALAAQLLHGSHAPQDVGFIGCGPINFEVLRFLCVIFGGLQTVRLCDVDPSAEEWFRSKSMKELPGIRVISSIDAGQIFELCPLVSIATNAVVPHITESRCIGHSTILHLSLRDLAPRLIISHDNVVDHMDHICSSRTSLHLAEEAAGNRSFIRCTLSEVLLGSKPARQTPECTTIFSPFGLGILDLAVARWVYEQACTANCGLHIESFFPRRMY